MSIPNNSLSKRVLTAIVLILAAIFSYYFYKNIGVLVFGLFLVFLSSIEYAGMHFQISKAKKRLSLIYLIINTLILFATVHGQLPLMLLGVLFVFTTTLGVWALRGEASNDKQLKTLGEIFVGLIYIGLFAGLGLRLLRFEDTEKWFWLLLVAVSAGDVAAYFCGRAFGKRHLFPSMSPNKTWAGFWGAVVVAIIVCVGFQNFIMPSAPIGIFVLLGLVISFAAQTGDLFESLLKRAAGRKDSGRILPGHGGVLDRIDGHLFAAPIVYFTQYFIS